MTAKQLSDPQKLKGRAGQIPARRIGEPRDIADTALSLVSDEASYVTGGCFFVDGGLLLSPAG